MFRMMRHHRLPRWQPVPIARALSVRRVLCAVAIALPVAGQLSAAVAGLRAGLLGGVALRGERTRGLRRDEKKEAQQHDGSREGSLHRSIRPPC